MSPPFAQFFKKSVPLQCRIKMGMVFRIILIYVWVQSFDIGVEHILCLETVNYGYVTVLLYTYLPHKNKIANFVISSFL
jgi:hypothetical protein